MIVKNTGPKYKLQGQYELDLKEPLLSNYKLVSIEYND